MGTVLITLKLMPESPEVDLEALKNTAKEVIEKGEGKIGETKEEPIAFGLKALIISFSLDENKELEPIEKQLQSKEEVSSVQIMDMRRAFG